MGVIKQGILGGFSGSVGGVTGSSWKGIAVMKSKPLSVANPNTEAQQSQRTSFKTIALLASQVLTTVCQIVYNPIAQKMSGYNLFCKQNKLAFSGSGVFTPANAYIGGGSLKNVTVTDGTYDSVEKRITCSYDTNVDSGSTRENDLIHGYAYCPDTEDVFAVSSATARSNESCVLQLITDGSDLQGALNVYFFLSPISTDGRSVGVKQNGTLVEVDFGS